MPAGALPSHPLLRLIARVAIHAGAFGYLSGIFLIALDLVELFPATHAIAVGRVTIDGASKTADYAGAILFYLLVGVCTPLLAAVGLRWFRRVVSPAVQRTSDAGRALLALTFSLPFCLAPLLHLTTKKEVWPLFLPPLLGWGACRLWREVRTSGWLRAIYESRMAGFHALVLASGAAWLLFRYLVKGALIAHVPTLLLEVIFVAFFLFAFDAAGVFIARMAGLATGCDERRAFAAYAWSIAPLLTLPAFGLVLVPEEPVIVAAGAACLLIAIVLAKRDLSDSGGRAWSVAAFLAWPWLLFAWSYASTAALTSWIDLFHRGEALGPASDFLAGDLPYRDVFILHGLLENGFLDAGLMRLFGRDASVSITRAVVTGSFTLPVLYAIALVLFRRIPVALVTVLVGMVTFADNQRIVFHLLVVLFLLASHRRNSAPWSFLAGLTTGVAIFYSLDIGMYALATILVVPVVLAVVARRPLLRPFIASLGGLLCGVAPFAVYLLSIGVLGRFFEESFITLPRLIEAVWSLPYPDLAKRFRSDLSLRGLTGFVLGEEMRFVLNPLVLAVAIGAIVARWRKRIAGFDTVSLIILTVAALFAQRSALGRADFRHQYFAAYLIAPLLILLLIAGWRRLNAARVDGGSAAFLLLLAPVVILLGSFALWVPDLLNARLGATIQYRPRISGIGFEDRQAETVGARIEAVTAAVRERVPEGASIFDFSNQPAFYFYADRRNPTRFFQIPIAATERYQAEIIRDLRSSMPEVVLRESPEGYDRFDGIENERRAPQLAEFIETHWEYEETVHGVELWGRRDVPVRRGRVRLASTTEAWADDFLVFPAVASAQGAAESQWQSTLIAFNDDDEPLPLRLRYMSSAGNRDAGATVPARGTLVLTDLVHTFFGMPETSGTLLVRYPQSRRPVLAMETIDTRRPASLTISAPLESDVVADALRANATLAIVGLRGGDQRRINIGLVNVGQGDMMFNISLRRGDGSIAGTPVEGVVAEGERYQLVDSERTFGASIQSGNFVHVRIHEGRAIGFASVIDGVTGASQLVPARPSVYP